VSRTGRREVAVSLRTPITLVVLFVVLMGAAYYGWQTVISPGTEDHDPPATSSKPKCENVEEFHKGQLIRSKDVLVNVYNAGRISGLASDTLSELSDRGFNPGVSDNAPAAVTASNVTILTSSRQSPLVQLVAQQFQGVVKYAKGRGLDPGVDIIVGDDFQGLNVSAKTSLRVKRSISTCTSTDTAQS
jgi:hypothetical protein